jgi:hypothetical protein
MKTNHYGDIINIGGGAYRCRMRDRYLYLHSPDRIPTIKDFEQYGFDLGVLAPAFAGAMNNKRKAKQLFPHPQELR